MQPSAAVFAFSVSCLLALAATPMARRVSLHLGWRDRPERRKVHLAARPTAGGLAISIALGLSLLLTSWSMPGAAAGLVAQLRDLGPALALITAIGLLDDVRGTRPSEKLLVQIVALGWLQATTGLLTPGAAGIDPSVLAVLLALFFLATTNAINLVDGLDALATGLSVSAAAGSFVLACAIGDAGLCTLAAATIGACLGFLRLNRSPARIFLGDSGSLFLGTLLAYLALRIFAARPGVEIALGLMLVLWVPLLDTGFAVVRRVVSGVHPFRPDRDHLHHRLLRRGFSAPAAARRLWTAGAISMVFGVGLGLGAPVALGPLGIVLATLPLAPLLRPARVTTGAPEEPAAVPEDALDPAEAAAALSGPRAA